MRFGLSRFGALFAGVIVPLALFACGDDDDQPGPKDAMAPLVDTSVAEASVVDSNAPPMINNCTTYTDMTALKTVMITFPTGPAPAQYTNPCVKVKAGTVVTFAGSFGDHPLEPKGGTAPSPIPALTMTGASLPVTFAAAGTFGFDCMFHPGIMLGAVQVVP